MERESEAEDDVELATRLLAEWVSLESG